VVIVVVDDSRYPIVLRRLDDTPYSAADFQVTDVEMDLRRFLESSAMTTSTTRSYQAINLVQKLGLISEQWSPRVVAELNDYQFKVVRIEGDFIWHDHPETDEAFLVLEGELRIDFRDGAVLLRPGELFVVPKGVEHKPYAAKEVKLLLIEPRGILNTGHAGGERTAQNDIWI
jgi:mannose-6-phosphate isomerase-like protein (cupin superfamily)